MSNASIVRWGLIPAVVLFMSAGCLPDLPPPPAADDDTGGDGAVTTMGTSTGPGADSDSTTATDSNDETESTDGSESSSSSSGTGNDPPAGCAAIDALTIEGDSVSNCHVGIEFDEAVVLGPSALRAPGGSDENLLFSHDDGHADQYSGVLMFAPDSESWSGSEPMDDSVYVMQEGPAVYRIWIPWEAATGDLEGHSVYTVLADGRIFRDEYVHLLDPMGDHLVAYVSLESVPTITDVRWGGDGSDVYEPAPVGNGGTDPIVEGTSRGGRPFDFYTCAHNTDTGDTVGWAQYEGGAPWHGPRATWHQGIAGTPETAGVSLQADWFRAETLPATEVFGEIMMHVTADADDPCGAIASYYASYRGPGQITVVSGAEYSPFELIGDEGDGDFFSQGGGFYYLVLPTDGTDDVVFTIEGGADVHPTALVQVAGLGASEVAGVEVAGTPLEPEEYIVQDAMQEIDGLAWGLPAGVFVLVGVPIESGVEVTINR